MRLVKLTDSDGDELIYDGENWYEEGIEIDGKPTTQIIGPDSRRFVVFGTPAEVAAKLAGEASGDGTVDYIDPRQLIELADKLDAMTAERDALAKSEKDALDQLKATRDSWGITRKERDEAREYLMEIAVALGRPRSDAANRPRLTQVADRLKLERSDAERERDEARAALASIQAFAQHLGWNGAESESLVDFFEAIHPDEAPPEPETDGEPEGAMGWLKDEPDMYDDVADEEDEEGCPAVGPRLLLCTLDEGHDGEHVAHGFPHEVLATWPQDDDEPAGEAPPPVTAPPTVPPVTPPVTPPTGTLTHPLQTVAPSSTCGITVSSGTGSFLPLTRKSDGLFLRGCSYVLFMPSDGDLRIIGDSSATDGQVHGPIRYRTNNGGNPFDEDRGSSSASVNFGQDGKSHVPTKLWPIANGPITMDDLNAMQAPLVDAHGSKWWRVEFWEDNTTWPGYVESQHKSHATRNGGVCFVCVLAPGQTAPRPPAVGYHAEPPITIGNPVVHPLRLVTDNDPSPSEGEVPSPLLFGVDETFEQIRQGVDFRIVNEAVRLEHDPFQSKRGHPKYELDREAGHHVTLRNQTGVRAPQYSAIITARKLLDGTATEADKRFLKLYALNNGLSAPELQIVEHGDRTELHAAFSYDTPFEESFSVAVVYSWGRKFNLWTPSEEARIRGQLARFVWISLQLHRNPYAKWINANGACQAMWESARDWASGLISLVMPKYQSAQYREAVNWRAFFIGGQGWKSGYSRSGLYGLLDPTKTWNDKGGRYFTSNNCAGPLALTLHCLATSGETVPDYYEDAFIAALNGILKGAEGVAFWSPFMCNSNFPRLRDDILAKYNKDAVIAAGINLSHSNRNNGSIPGGNGAGSAAVSLFCVEVV